MASHQVVLYLYDLSQGMAQTYSRSFLGQQIDGIWHTGVIVFGQEYFYGGGINIASPGQTPYGSPVRQIPIGETTIPQELFHEFLQGISNRFTPASYNIITHNCNNFSNEVSMFLTGKPIPSYITGLPQDVLNTPMGRMLRPMLDNMQQNMMQYTQDHQLFGQPFGAVPSQAAVVQDKSLNGLVESLHRHARLSLPLTQSRTPIVFKSFNSSVVFDKLDVIIEENQIPLTKDHKSALNNLRGALNNNEATIVTVSAGQVAVCLHILALLPIDQSFPALDIIRIIALNKMGNDYFCGEGKIQLALILDKFVHLDSPKAARIMALRFACNMFSSERGAALMIDEVNLPRTMRCFMDAIGSDDAAGALVYELSLHMPSVDSDDRAQCIASIVHQLGQESDEDVALSLLLALAHFVYCNDDAVEMAGLLGLDLDKWSSVNKLQGIVNELKLM